MKVSVGITTVIGWLTALGGVLPIVVKLLEEGASALTIGGPEKWAAIIGLVSLAVTNIGRYLQSVHLIKASAPHR
jgi:hypothetical protein